MWFRKKKKRDTQWTRDAIPQVFLVLGFFAAAFTQEVMNIIHSFALSWGQTGYTIYAISTVILWAGMFIYIMKMMDRFYGK